MESPRTRLYGDGSVKESRVGIEPESMRMETVRHEGISHAACSLPGIGHQGMSTSGEAKLPLSTPVSKPEPPETQREGETREGEAPAEL